MTKTLRILGKRGRITIPYEIRQIVGFKYNDVLSFTVQNDDTVTVKRETICDNKCPYLPNIKPTKEEKQSLAEYLDGLTAEEQKVALVHLSVKWAIQQGVDVRV